jgi:hypothetical protein
MDILVFYGRRTKQGHLPQKHPLQGTRWHLHILIIVSVDIVRALDYPYRDRGFRCPMGTA